jgi:biopolymer transport protein ExbD
VKARAVSGIMPLLDVLFILLFSLLAMSDAKKAESEEQEEVRIELPGVEAGESAEEPLGETLVLEVDASGLVTLAESGASIADRRQLDTALSTLLGDRLPEEVSVEIHADLNAPHGVAVELLQFLRLRGIARVQMLATGYAEGEAGVFGGGASGSDE